MNITFFSNKTNTEYYLIPICSNYTTVGKNVLTRFHIHPVYHMMFVTEGSGILENDTSKYPLQVKNIFLINPNEKHIFSSNEGFTYYTFNFYLLDVNKCEKGFITQYLMNNVQNDAIEKIAETAKLQDIFDFKVKDIYFTYEQLLWDKILLSINSFSNALGKLKFLEINSFKENYVDERRNWFNYFSKFFWDFYLSITFLQDISPEIKKGEELLERIIQYLQSKVYDSLSLADLAAYTNYSSIYLCAYFKHKTGLTLGQYFYKLKIMKSCEYLRSTGKSINEIAAILNYSSAGHFSRSFKNEKKMTPSEYRKCLESY